MNFVTQRTHVGSDELERLFQGVRVPETGVEDMTAKRDARQQCLVLVDAVDSVQHRLGALNPLLALNRATDLQPADNLSSILHCHLLGETLRTTVP